MPLDDDVDRCARDGARNHGAKRASAGRGGPSAAASRKVIICRQMSVDKLCDDVWLLTSGFKFYNLFAIGLNGLVLRVRTRDSAFALVLINPPKLTRSVVTALREIELETGARVELIVQPGDWHHFQLPAAQAMFPEARMYVASERNLRKQPSLNATVLDRTAPCIPELSEAQLQLLPWLGYTQDGMPRAMSGEKRGAPRIEFVVAHKPSGTLFITDHFFPPKRGAPLAPNTGGFKLADAEAAQASVRRVAAFQARRLVFSHGKRDACVLETEAAAVLEAAHARLLAAHTESSSVV